MKILVLQLARLGDIYLSWPGLRALKRQQPDVHVTLLTRTAFAAAASELDAVDEVLCLDSRHVLEPLIQDSMDVPASHARLSEFVRDLRSRQFDRVVNLSFSPASSYLVHLLKPDASGVTGYSRTDDGFLSIPDDMSAYFYAQVGPGRPNRFHLAEIFGTLLGVDIAEEDWRHEPRAAVPMDLPAEFIAVHVGASEAQKSLSPNKWVSILSHFRPQSALPWVLLGSANESATGDFILSAAPTGSVINVVGKTSLAESFAILKRAKVLLGADSALQHMASLCGTRSLNLSVGNVNFWETGPRARGSWVVRAANEVDLSSEKAARALALMITDQKPEIGIIQVQPGTPSYQGLFPREAEFHWKITQAIYQGLPYPEPVSPGFWEAHAQLLDINAFVLDQLRALEAGSSLEAHAGFIDRGEEVIASIAKLVPAWGPAVRWYQTEKIRIGPGDQAAVLRRTREIQELFQQMLELYADMKANETALESEAP